MNLSELANIAQIVMGIATICIALLALEVSQRQTETNKQLLEEERRFKRLSVKPILVIVREFKPPEAIKIVNMGIGPAIINEIKILTHANGSLVEIVDPSYIDIIIHAISKLKLEVDKFEILSLPKHATMAISAGEELPILKNHSGINLDLNALLIGFAIVINYESIYGEKISINSG